MELGDVYTSQSYTKLATRSKYNDAHYTVYIQAALLYLEFADTTEAYRALEKCLQTIDKGQERDMGMYYFGMGKYFFLTQQYPKAIEYSQKARNNMKKAIEYFQKARNNMKKVKDKLQEGIMWFELAKCFAERGDFDTAKSFIDTAKTRITTDDFNEYYELLFTEGEILLKKHTLKDRKLALERAINSFNDALKMTVNSEDDFNIYSTPLVSNIKLELPALKATARKGELFLEHYDSTQNIKSLEGAIQNLELSIQLLDNLRTFYGESVESTKYLNENFYSVYANYIEACYFLAQEKSKLEGQLYEKAFIAAEKSKSFVLKSSIIEKRHTDNLIDDDVKAHLKFLNLTIRKYRETENSQLYKKIQERDSLYTEIKEKNKGKEYYNLVYNSEVVSLQFVQENLIETNTAIIEYLQGEEHTYIFTISKNSFDLERIKSDGLSDKISKLRKNIFLQKKDAFTEDTINEKEFIELSGNLYSSLLEHSINKISPSINRLILIPSGSLHRLNFDILIENKNINFDDRLRYTNLDYLIKKYATRVVHSSTILNEISKLSSKNRTKATVGVFAPKYHPSLPDRCDLGIGEDKSEEGYCASLSADNSVKNLCLNEPKNIVDNIYGKGIATGWIGDETSVTKHIFEKEANQTIIYCSTHGCINESNSNYSSLLFEKDTSEYLGRLKVSDIFNLNFSNTDLFILSSCVTGYGNETSKSEGFNSLARAFQYSGCPSVIMSRTKVSVNVSEYIMDYFNRNIKAGMPTDIALQKAKLKYLEKAGQRSQVPYFWSSFLLLGNASTFSFN